MPISPELPIDKIVQERQSEVFSESLQQAGIQSTPANVTSVVNDQGQPIITTPATQSAKIQLPSDQASLLQKAKGKVADAATWLAKFLLRGIAIKAYANTNDTNTNSE